MSKAFYQNQFSKLGGSQEKSKDKMRAVTPETYGIMASSKKPEQYFPSFSLQLSDIPEAKNWEVGKRYKLAVEVIQKALSITDKRETVVFELRKVKAL